jgi:hypothetical protein
MLLFPFHCVPSPYFSYIICMRMNENTVEHSKATFFLRHDSICGTSIVLLKWRCKVLTYLIYFVWLLIFCIFHFVIQRQTYWIFINSK